MDEKRIRSKPGISSADLSVIIRIIGSFPAIEQARIFGSRAIGNHKPGSDIDICIFGVNLSYDTSLQLKSSFEETPLPYFFDIVNYDKIINPELKQHINQHGIVIFTRSKSAGKVMN